MAAHLRPWEYFKPEKGRHQPPTLLWNRCHQFPCCRSSQPAFSPNAHTVCSAKMLLRHSKNTLQTTSHLHHWQFQLWTEKVVGCIRKLFFSTTFDSLQPTTVKQHVLSSVSLPLRSGDGPQSTHQEQANSNRHPGWQRVCHEAREIMKNSIENKINSKSLRSLGTTLVGFKCVGPSLFNFR